MNEDLQKEVDRLRDENIKLFVALGQCRITLGAILDTETLHEPLRHVVSYLQRAHEGAVKALNSTVHG